MKIVIVGAGEVGFHVASHLALENKDVVVIDKNPDALRYVSNNIDVQVINGPGSSPLILKEAGIKEAEVLLAVTDSDEINLAACLVANIVAPSTKKLARIRDADYDEYHEALREQAPYIDTIINPEIEVVKKIFRLMNVPGAVEVNDFADGRVVFIGLYIDGFAKLSGVRLSDIYAKTGKQSPLIAAVVRDEELIIPRGKHKLKAGDLIYFISEKEKLVEAKPRKGFFVRLFTVKEMVNIFELREVLEGLAARRAAICITDKQVNKLNRFFKQFSSPIDHAQYKSYAGEDRHFHSYVTEIGSKEFLKSILQAYNIISFSYQMISSEGLVRPPDETIHEHRAMIDAICNRAYNDAETLMREHFTRTIALLKNEIGKRSIAVNH